MEPNQLEVTVQGIAIILERTGRAGVAHAGRYPAGTVLVVWRFAYRMKSHGSTSTSKETCLRGLLQSQGCLTL